jgi:hypothetical protein
MQQTFRATILNGTICATEASTPLEMVILQAVKRKHRNNQFMRFLLAELLECQFIPALLPTDEFAPLLEAMTDWDTRTANSVEINAVNFNGPYCPLIVATAEFILPVKYQLQPQDYSYEMSMDKSLQNAVRFYWTWRDGKAVDMAAMEDAYHRIYSETISFEMVEPT